LRNRVKNIFNHTEKKLDAIIIKNSIYPFIDNNFFYITGLTKGIFEESLSILYPDGTLDLIVSELEAESASKVNLPLHIFNNQDEFNKTVKKLTSSYKNIGINYAGLSHIDFCKLNEILIDSIFVDISRELMEVRLVKDKLEIQQIRKACSISDTVMKKIPDLIYEGMYEYEIAAEIDYHLQKLGADNPAFQTISSFDKNTSEPHYSHGDTKLKNGDFTLFDFGACVQKYNSDISRTYVFGQAEKKQKEMYEIVLEAQHIGFEMIKPEVSGIDVHKAVESSINDTKFKGCFIHSTGHSLGLAVHDGTMGLSPKSNLILKENMVFTVEPGVYIPGFGGVRIEDDILIKKDGIELLTKCPKDFIEI
jgi:Xaa-Pro dipeptidase